MSDGRLSLNELRERYEQEDLELSADFTFKANVSIYKLHDDEGKPTGESMLLINLVVDDEYVAHGFLEVVDKTHWSLDSIQKTLKLDPDAKIWETEELG